MSLNLEAAAEEAMRQMLQGATITLYDNTLQVWQYFVFLSKSRLPKSLHNKLSCLLRKWCFLLSVSKKTLKALAQNAQEPEGKWKHD